MVLADTSGAAINYLIALAGSGGLISAIYAFVRLRGDRDSQAVSQAQGAMETMDDLNQALERSLVRANERGDHYKRLYEQVSAELDRIRAQWGPFPVKDER